MSNFSNITLEEIEKRRAVLCEETDKIRQKVIKDLKTIEDNCEKLQELLTEVERRKKIVDG